ncbi:hypothetical protein HY374_02465 [Candidatus Berkelbacteria bacterium]|nr:hypothetical protein [Candidatus Berkelbacteria bacterium]
MIPSLVEKEDQVFRKRFDWASIDVPLARSKPRVLDLVREACLIESYFGNYMGKLEASFWDDVDATCVFAVEGFEAYTHFRILARYLAHVGYKPVTDADVVALRAKDRSEAHDDPIVELVNFMATEHFAADFFRDLATESPEPILSQILERLSSEEVLHSRFALELLKKRFDADPDPVGPAILRAASRYQHIGSYVLPTVSNVKIDNVASIRGFNQQVEELVGTKLSTYLAQSKEAAHAA